MKTAYQSYEEVVRRWVMQAQEAAHTPRYRLFFEGRVIYSYGTHFPIANITEIRGHTVTLFTTQRYSNTTVKHKNVVWNALQRNAAIWRRRIIEVPFPLGTVSANIAELENEITALRIKRAAARKPELHDPAINKRRNTIKILRELSGVAPVHQQPELIGIEWNLPTTFEGD